MNVISLKERAILLTVFAVVVEKEIPKQFTKKSINTCQKILD